MSSAVQLPIQPFDDTLRSRIRLAIGEAFERDYRLHEIDYDPDTVDDAADRVIALLVEGLLGVRVEVLPKRVVGNGVLRIDPNQGAFSEDFVARLEANLSGKRMDLNPKRRRSTTLSQAIVDVLAEHQVAMAKYEESHDDIHRDELGTAAAVYAAGKGVVVQGVELWIEETFAKHQVRGQTRREALVRAGSYLLSEIESIDRIAKRDADAAAEAELASRIAAASQQAVGWVPNDSGGRA